MLGVVTPRQAPVQCCRQFPQSSVQSSCCVTLIMISLHPDTCALHVAQIRSEKYRHLSVRVAEDFGERGGNAARSDMSCSLVSTSSHKSAQCCLGLSVHDASTISKHNTGSLLSVARPTSRRSRKHALTLSERYTRTLRAKPQKGDDIAAKVPKPYEVPHRAVAVSVFCVGWDLCTRAGSPAASRRSGHLDDVFLWQMFLLQTSFCRASPGTRSAAVSAFCEGNPEARSQTLVMLFSQEPFGTDTSCVATISSTVVVVASLGKIRFATSHCSRSKGCLELMTRTQPTQ